MGYLDDELKGWRGKEHPYLGDSWKPEEYKLNNYIVQKEPIKKMSKKQLIKTLLICGIPCAVATGVLIYETIPYMIQYRLKLPF